MNDIITYFYTFLLGSIAGCLLETIWCILRNKRYESRKGLVYGYFIPIYGVGTMLLSIFTDIFNIKSSIEVYILTFIICFIVEYVSSYLEEKIFNTKSWDYSNMKFNIKGRVNALYLSLWSLIGVLWVKFIPKLIKSFLLVLKKYRITTLVTSISSVYIIYDIIISLIVTYRQKLRRKGIKAKNKIEMFIDKKYNDEFLKTIFANSVEV